MKFAALLLSALLIVAGCAKESSINDSSADNAATAPVATITQAAQPTAQQQQDASAAEQALRSMGVPMYADAKVDATQHSSTDPNAVNAVFTTTATTKQVEYFYNGYPELKSQAINGMTVFSGKLNGVQMVITVRPGKSGTEILAQCRDDRTSNTGTSG